MVSEATIERPHRSLGTAGARREIALERDTEERMTSDHRTSKQRPPEPRESTKPTAAGEPGRTEPERKPDPSEALEWRGAGVCGDRQTD